MEKRKKGNFVMSKLFKNLISKKDDGGNKKKIENLVFLIIILVVTLIAMNTIWNGGTSENKGDLKNTEPNKILAYTNDQNGENYNDVLESKLEKILNTINGVGEVKVFINYAESSSIVPLYDETTTTSNTEEGDSGGGKRNVTETETQKEVVFSENSGKKEPVTQKTTMPVVQGAIVTAEGAQDASIKAKIVSAVGAVTGLTVDKIQVFQMKNSH